MFLCSWFWWAAGGFLCFGGCFWLSAVLSRVRGSPVSFRFARFCFWGLVGCWLSGGFGFGVVGRASGLFWFWSGLWSWLGSGRVPGVRCCVRVFLTGHWLVGGSGACFFPPGLFFRLLWAVGRVGLGWGLFSGFCCSSVLCWGRVLVGVRFRGGVGVLVLFGEFDPGSGRTLAACLTHASRTGPSSFFGGGLSGERVSIT